MASRKRKKVTKSLVVSAKIEPWLKNRLDKQAAEYGYSRSRWIRFLLMQEAPLFKTTGVPTH